jgi:uncharacterized membrane protein YphA (DoxX/SURF4 family)
MRLHHLLAANAPRATVLIRLLVGAVLATKLPILLEQGFWAVAHEARTDWSMLLGSPFLLVVGAGPWSVDARLSHARSGSARPSRD